MANLIGWLGKEIAAPIKRDVLRPINNAVAQPLIRNVYQPVERNTVQPIQRAAPQIAHNVFSPSSPYSVPNVAGGVAQGIVHTGQQANNLAQGTVQQTLKIPLEAFATAKEAYTGQPTTLHLTPRESILTGTPNVQSIQQIARSNYQGAKQGAHPGLAGAGTAALVLAHLAQDFGPPVLKGVKATKALGTNEIGAAGKNVNLSPDELKLLQKQGFDTKTITKMAGPQGQKMAPPARIPGSPRNPRSGGEIIPQVSSERKITSLTSPANRLNRSGVGGQGALQVIRDKEIGARIHTQQLADTAKPFYNLSNEQQAAAIKVHKGEFTTKDPNVQAGANSLRAMFQQAHERAVNAKIKVGNQGANYFPQSYPREWFKNPKTINRAAQQLVANGQAPDLETAIGKLNKIKIESSVNSGVYGHFKPRTTDIPGTENARVVTNYIRGASDAIAAAEHFGPKNAVLKSHIANAVRNGEDATAVRDIVSNYLHPKQPGTGVVSKGLSGYQKGLRIIQLPRAAISHGPQGFANTASDIGYKNYFKSMRQKINMTSADKKFLHDNGFRSEKVAPPEGLAGKATAPGLGHLLQFHRDVAALGGRNMALHAAETGDTAALKDMAISGKLVKGSDGKIKLTEAQKAQAGHFEANKSIGSSSRLESPTWTQTEGGKLVGMYRKMYTFKQAERIGNWLTEARNGNPGPLIKYLAIGAPASGLTVALAKAEIKNPGSNPLADKKKLAVDTFHNSGAGSVGYGTVDSAVNAAAHNYGNDSRWSNAAGAVSPGAGFAVQTGQHIAKGVHGNWNPLERQGFQSLPVAGTALANKFAPVTPYQKDHGVGVSGKQTSPGIYQSKAKDGSTKYKTLQSSKMTSFPSLEAAKTAQAKNIFKFSNQQTTTINGKQYHKTAAGHVAAGPIPATGDYNYKLPNGQSVNNKKITSEYTLHTANLTSSKNSGDVNGYIKTAQDQLNNISAQLHNPKLTPTKAQQLANEAQSLQSNINKYSSYGGFTKPVNTSAYKSVGPIQGANPSYVSAITQSAAKYGVDINAALSVAAVEGLGGGVGDNGTSFGPFQLHVGGALPPGKDQAWAESPAGIDYALQQISKVAGGKSGADAVAAIVNGFERPADPSSEVANALALYSGGSATLASGSPKSARIKAVASAKNKTATSKAIASYKTASTAKAPPRPKGVSVRVPKAPTATKTRKLSVSKIPTSYKGKKIA